MPVRYGVFLTPDPATCVAVTAVTTAVRALYGFVSAGAFPPHATLAGSLPIGVGEDEFVDGVRAVVARHRRFEVENAGVQVLGDVVVYDVDRIGGSRNAALLDLALGVDAAVRPMLVPAPGFAADVHDASNFHGHLSLARHELWARPDLKDEVAAFARALPVPHPTRFTADAVTVYRFEHPTWSDEWWRALTWEHVRTLHLA